MSVTPASFKELFPEFVSQSDARVQLFLDQASRRISSDAFGDLYDDGQSYLTAHLLAVNIRAAGMALSGASGPLSSTTVGPLSKTYASNFGAVTGTDNYDATPYGQEFQRLMNLCFLTPRLAW